MSMRFSYHVNGKPALHCSKEVQEIVYEIDGRFGLSLEYDSDAGVWLLVTSQAIPDYFLRKLTAVGADYQDLSAPTVLGGTAVKEAYEFTCAICGHEQMAAPSLAMQFGHNSGHGSCLNCGTFLHLEIDSGGETMVSQEWDDYLKSREGQEARP